MTTDSETTEQYITFVWSRFLISVLVFVSRDFELGTGVTLIQFANAIAITFARWRPQSRTGLIFIINFYNLHSLLSRLCFCLGFLLICETAQKLQMKSQQMFGMIKVD